MPGVLERLSPVHSLPSRFKMARFVLDLLLGLTDNPSAIATPDRGFLTALRTIPAGKVFVLFVAPAAQRARSLWRQPLAGAASITIVNRDPTPSLPCPLRAGRDFLGYYLQYE